MRTITYPHFAGCTATVAPVKGTPCAEFRFEPSVNEGDKAVFARKVFDQLKSEMLSSLGKKVGNEA